MAEHAGFSIASIFIGPNGLRAGWRFLLFALAIEIGVFVLEEPLGKILGRLFAVNPRELSAPALLIDEFVFCLSVFLITGIFALAEHRRIDSYGLPVEQAFGKYFWKGMLAALLVVLFMAGAMILSGAMVLYGLALHGGDLARLAFLWFFANILVGLAEEYTFRGYALQSLWRGAGFWPAALITTAIFAGDHLEKPGENAMDIGMIFFLGLILCLSMRKTGSLWWAVGWHAGFDFGQLFLIGTRNGGQTPGGRLFNVTFPGPPWLNGGELGTEASIFMVPAAIATWIYVIWFLRGPPRDQQTLYETE
jgi:CAAX protease family protein